MTSLRCLWVTRLVPYPPFIGGDATYSSRLIESLAMSGVELTVLSHDNGGPPPVTSGIEWVTVPFRDRSPRRSLLGRAPAMVHRFSTPQIRDGVDSLVRNRSWDAVLVDNVAVVGSVDLGRRAWGSDGAPALVYVSHNHEETNRRQLAVRFPHRSPNFIALRWDAAKTAAIERRLVDAADLVTAITEEDAVLFRRRTPQKRYLVLTPGYDGPEVSVRTIDAQTPRRISLLGSYVWIAKQLNVWRFLEAAVGPLSRAGVGIDVVGGLPDAFENRLRATFPNVTVTGRVDRVEAHLARARMGIVVEEIGGGFKLKTLDYVFNRLPVASLAGSVAGTPLAAGTSILEFPDMTRLVEGIIDTIDDFPRLNAVQEAAFRACQGRFAWADRGQALATSLNVLRTRALGAER